MRKTSAAIKLTTTTTIKILHIYWNYSKFKSSSKINEYINVSSLGYNGNGKYVSRIKTFINK